MLIHDVLRDAPVNITKSFYLLSILLFFVIIGGAGATILPIGIILIITQLVDDSVNTVNLAGYLFILLGIGYLFIFVIVFAFAGLSLYTRTKKITGKLAARVD